MIEVIRCLFQRLAAAVAHLVHEVAREEVGEPRSPRRKRRPSHDTSATVTIICDARHVSAQGRILQFLAEGLQVGCAVPLHVGQTVRCALTWQSAGAALRLTVTSRREVPGGYRYTLRAQRGRLPLHVARPLAGSLSPSRERAA